MDISVEFTLRGKILRSWVLVAFIAEFVIFTIKSVRKSCNQSVSFASTFGMCSGNKKIRQAYDIITPENVYEKYRTRFNNVKLIMKDNMKCIMKYFDTT